MQSFESSQNSGAIAGHPRSVVPLVGAYYERTHRPDKLTSFDKIFSHEFLVPTCLVSESSSMLPIADCHVNMHLTKSGKSLSGKLRRFAVS